MTDTATRLEINAGLMRKADFHNSAELLEQAAKELRDTIRERDEALVREKAANAEAAEAIERFLIASDVHNARMELALKGLEHGKAK